MACISDMVEPRMDRVLTQYRESANLLYLLRTYLQQAEIVHQHVCDLPDAFDIESAEGDQLTLIGKRLGFGRCHCVCTTQPVFGFDCDGPLDAYSIAGFCNDNVRWENCEKEGLGTICITSDAIYRKFLQVRRYQMVRQYDIESLKACIKIFWGEMAMVVDAGHGRVVVTPGRALAADEIALLQLYPRVLPIAPGISCRFHFAEGTIFGFGEGWGGFCEENYPDGIHIATHDNDMLLADDGMYLHTGTILKDTQWLCAFDVSPYSC